MWDIVAQIIGIFAMSIAIYSFQGKSSNKILFLQQTANCFWALHYLILGAYTGAILNLYSAGRNLVYSNLNKKETAKQSRHYSVILAIISVVLSLLTYQNWFTLLAMTGTLIQTFSFSCKQPNKLRIFTLTASPFWLSYNLLAHSYSGMITELFCMCSMIIGICRNREEKDKE